MRRDFVTNASHELKTPVASILAAAETLQLAFEKAPERVPQFAAQIEAAARSLAQLVNDLLDLSRLEGRRSEHGPVELGALVADEVDRVRSFAEEKGVRLESDLSEAWVLGSEPDLGLAIRNLLDNASGTNVAARSPSGSSGGGRAVVSVKTLVSASPARWGGCSSGSTGWTWPDLAAPEDRARAVDRETRGREPRWRGVGPVRARAGLGVHHPASVDGITPLIPDVRAVRLR